MGDQRIRALARASAAMGAARSARIIGVSGGEIRGKSIKRRGHQARKS